jgi:hypothetical protein
MKPPFRVFIGFDEREREAAFVANHSLVTTSGIAPEWLICEALRDRGLLYRLMDKRDSKFYDMVSNKPASTEFAISRFLVPILCQSGWALFTDCDVVFYDDVHKLLDLADPHYAVQVVKHQYVPTSDTKMDSQPQLRYARKNWSSVMLFNCEHPANRRLSLNDVNQRAGLYLHTFGWLHDSEIGELPPGWNWLVGEQLKPAHVALAHFTLGVPTMPGHENDDHAGMWLEARVEAHRAMNGFIETSPALREN